MPFDNTNSENICFVLYKLKYSCAKSQLEMVYDRLRTSIIQNKCAFNHLKLNWNRNAIFQCYKLKAYLSVDTLNGKCNIEMKGIVYVSSVMCIFMCVIVVNEG